MTQIFPLFADFYKHTCHISGFSNSPQWSHSLSSADSTSCMFFFFAFYPFSLGDQRDEERMKILSPAWVPGMLDRPLPHAFLRPPEAKDRVSLTGKRTKSGLTWSKTLKFDFTQTFSLTKLYIVLILWHLKRVFSWSHFWSRLLTLRIGCSLPHT